MRYIKDYWQWFIMFGIIVLCLFFNIGCGITEKEVTTEENTIYSEVVRREPYPILRAYEKKDGYIEFTDTTSRIELTRIYHDHSTEDSVNVICPSGNDGNVITIQFRGDLYNYTVYDDNYHNLVFFPGAGDDWADGKYLGIIGDMLDVEYQYDYIRLFINNVLVEYYYLSDF